MIKSEHVQPSSFLYLAAIGNSHWSASKDVQSDKSKKTGCLFLAAVGCPANSGTLPTDHIQSVKEVAVARGIFTQKSQPRSTLQECKASSALLADFVCIQKPKDVQGNLVFKSNAICHDHARTCGDFETRAGPTSQRKRGYRFLSLLNVLPVARCQVITFKEAPVATGIFTQRSQQQANLLECKASSILQAALGCMQNANTFKEVLSSNGTRFAIAIRRARTSEDF